jgi:ATP-binding cassette, subfamily C (CFTR/MRP), member 1
MGCMERIQAYIKNADHRDGRILMEKSVPSQTETKFETGSTEGELQNISISEKSVLPNISNDSLLLINGASFKSSSESPVILRDINLEVKRGTLTMIIGRVGSGKSTLMKAFLGEIPCVEGFVYSSVGQVAYCAQDTWLPNTNLRDIILGTCSYDSEWYTTVLESCLLHEDANRLPNNDLTLIGSKGASLSGGQKQRLVFHSYKRSC